jgi:hypothetical protein
MSVYVEGFGAGSRQQVGPLLSSFSLRLVPSGSCVKPPVSVNEGMLLPDIALTFSSAFPVKEFNIKKVHLTSAAI